MSEYYRPKRTKNIFTPAVNGGPDGEPFKLSRSKIDLFLECPRCFYFDRRLGVGRPPGFPFNLNSAVDHLLKKEFDLHRARETTHPLMKSYGIDAVPFAHADIDVWRENFVGVQALHRPSNFLVTGAVDDVWVSRVRGHEGELMVVDYKATSKDSRVTLDAEWQDGYKRQMEVYQWLLRQKGFTVSDTGYFVYANGLRDREAFDSKLEFDVIIIPYTGSDKWISSALIAAQKCLMDPRIPEQSADCDYCNYISAIFSTLKEVSGKDKEKENSTKSVLSNPKIKPKAKPKPSKSVASSTLF